MKKRKILIEKIGVDTIVTMYPEEYPEESETYSYKGNYRVYALLNVVYVEAISPTLEITLDELVNNFGASTPDELVEAFADLGFFSESNGSIEPQNNLIKPLYYQLEFSIFENTSPVSSAINQGPAFTVTETQIPLFVIFQPVPFDVEIPTPEIKKYFLKLKGKGNYGTGGIQLVENDLELITHQKAISEDVINLPTTQFLDLGDIGSDDIWDVVNISDPFSIQEQSVGYRVFRVISNDVELNYLFLAEGGLYGLGELQTDEDDFRLFGNGSSAVVVHNDLTGRDAPDAHPISAITGLQEVLDNMKFSTNFDYNLGAGKSLGKLTGSGIYPTIGKTHEEFLREIANEYIAPVFSLFTISGEPTTVEVGTTLSGAKTFTWGITLNNGIVPTIDIYDNTANATLLAATPNDGSQSQVITTRQLNATGATQSFRAIANNTAGANVNSGNFVVTSLYNRFWGAVATLPVSQVDGTANRTYANALSKAFKTNGNNSFTLATGTTHKNFIVLLPPGITITNVVDTTNLNANLTSEYVLSSITIKDAGGADRAYNQYTFTADGNYPVSANHVITTN